LKRACPVCKRIARQPVNIIQNPAALRCGQCYRERREMPSLAGPKNSCSSCGKVCAPTAKLCRACHYESIKPTPKPPAPPESIREPLASYQEAEHRWDQAIGRTRKKIHRIPKRPTGRERVVVIPDIHAPFHEPDQLAYICEVEGPKCSKAIALGDVSDAYAFSTFTKYEKVSFSEEWAAVTQVIDALSRSFHKVEIIIGNHDSRLEKRLAERLTPDMIDAVKYMTGGILCPLTALVKQYPNVTIARHETPSGHVVNWFTTDGDVWLGHPEKFSKVPSASLRALDDYLSDNELALGLEKYRLIVMGHTHQLEIIPWRGNQLLVSAGCLCQQAEYMRTPRIGGRPQKRGFVWYEKENGKVDLNSVGMHWFDAEKK
jgi:predicted phosphodiesterase